MIAIISSILIVISSLVVTLITSNPNFHNIMENDFIRSAKNNAYLYSWELGQINVRAGKLSADSKTIDTSLGYLNKKDTTETQKLKTELTYDPATRDLTIVVDKNDYPGPYYAVLSFALDPACFRQYTNNLPYK